MTASATPENYTTLTDVTLISDEPHVALGGDSHNLVGASADGSASRVEVRSISCVRRPRGVWQ
jgi:hypothetical protein